MRTLTLALFDLKRLSRHRPVLIALYAVPLVIAVARAAFAQSYFALACAWSCPLVCAAITWVVLYVQRSADRISGLDAALRSSPLSDNALLASRVYCGAIVFLGQMLIMSAVLVIRF